MILVEDPNGNIFLEGVRIRAEADGVSETKTITINLNGVGLTITGIEHHNPSSSLQGTIIITKFFTISGDVELDENGNYVIRDGSIVYV